MNPRKLVLLVLLLSLLVNVLLIAAFVDFYHLLHSQPVELDRNGHLVFKPGFTIPGRSLDAAGNGWNYHFTRYDSYKAPDWKPKTE